MPEALSLAPGDRLTVSMCPPTTIPYFTASGHQATTLREVPPSTENFWIFVSYP